MKSKEPIYLYNTLKRSKEEFIPISNDIIGIYLCGPTVYGNAHIGHARSAVLGDILVRYLKFQGYKVRYVRNITDVGHLEYDADDGQDKITKQSIIESKEPMEISNYYSNSYLDDMQRLNVLAPSIAPLASGHIIEQITFIEKIIKAGFAYIKNGSVYFKTSYYEQKFKYGKLSGRISNDLISSNRELKKQPEKNSPLDFALWKNADSSHIMRWPSSWGDGFPSWHIECSAMSNKYLFGMFDIHLGGLDLLFPHHECELAQAEVTDHVPPRYWLHNNMVNIEGQKMAKSLKNFVTLKDLFLGSMTNKPYSPMALRVFLLQVHYRSIIDFSFESLESSNVVYNKIANGFLIIKDIKTKNIFNNDFDNELHSRILVICENFHKAMRDDLNTAKALTEVLGLLHILNKIYSNSDHAIHSKTFELFETNFSLFVTNILGISEIKDSFDYKLMINIIFDEYKNAKAEKNYARVEVLRKKLNAIGIAVHDTVGDSYWRYVVS